MSLSRNKEVEKKVFEKAATEIQTTDLQSLRPLDHGALSYNKIQYFSQGISLPFSSVLFLSHYWTLKQKFLF